MRRLWSDPFHPSFYVFHMNVRVRRKAKSQKYEEKHRGPRSESLSIADVALAADVAE